MFAQLNQASVLHVRAVTRQRSPAAELSSNDGPRAFVPALLTHTRLVMPHFKLLLQYDGTDFHGWQIQNELRPVQRELSTALSLIDGQPVTVHGSGRTDAGVHAEGQVASVRLRREITPEKL